MTVALPDLGDGIKEADVVSVLVAVGDEVADGQDIIEVETGKAAMPVPSSAAGKVVAIHAEPGAKLAVGAPVIVVAASGGATPVAAPPLLRHRQRLPLPHRLQRLRHSQPQRQHNRQLRMTELCVLFLLTECPPICS